MVLSLVCVSVWEDSQSIFHNQIQMLIDMYLIKEWKMPNEATVNELMNATTPGCRHVRCEKSSHIYWICKKLTLNRTCRDFTSLVQFDWVDLNGVQTTGLEWSGLGLLVNELLSGSSTLKGIINGMYHICTNPCKPTVFTIISCLVAEIEVIHIFSWRKTWPPKTWLGDKNRLKVPGGKSHQLSK